MDIYLLEEYIRKFEIEHDISVDSDARLNLHTSLNDMLRHILYISIQLQRKSRRSELTCSDIYQALQVCGHYGSLPPPLYSSASNVDFGSVNALMTIDDTSPIISVSSYMNQPLRSQPRKSYVVTCNWVVLHGEGVGNRDDSNQLLRELRFKPYYRFKSLFEKYCRENDESQLQLLYDTLEMVPDVFSIAEPFFEYLSSEIHSILRVKPNTMAVELYRYVHTLYSIIHNDCFNCLQFNALFLPPLFSCLLATKLSSKDEENHWRIRNLAASALYTVYLKSKRTNGSCHDAILRTIKAQLESNSNSVGSVYGSLHFFAWMESTDIGQFLSKKYFTLFGENRHCYQYRKNAMVRREILEILHNYLLRSIDLSNLSICVRDDLIEEYTKLLDGQPIFSFIPHTSTYNWLC